MNSFKIILPILLVGRFAFADFATFDNLSDDDINTIIKEFSANLVHTSVTPPTALGKNFGMEVSAIVGAAESKGIDAISKRENPDNSVPYIPHAWLLLAVSVPYGLSLEVNYLPSVGAQNITARHSSAAVKWSITDQFMTNLPFDLAVRSYFGSSKLGFGQTLADTPTPGSSTQVDISYTSQMIGAETLLGFDFKVAEPYVGIGWVNSNAQLKGVASGDPSFSIFYDNVSQSKTVKQDSMRFLAGVQLNVTLVKISLEYSHVFSASRYSAKLGLAF